MDQMKSKDTNCCGRLHPDFSSGRIGGEAERIEAISERRTEKRHDADFALWKTQPQEELLREELEGASWKSNWLPGFENSAIRGRPGWHTECAAFGSSIFGESLDIHSGGSDLIFPHHQNEETQVVSYYHGTKPNISSMWKNESMEI